MLRPNGGTLIMQTGRPDTANLNLRIMGVRTALSGKSYGTPPGKMLKNDNGWTEAREPYPCFGRVDHALVQMEVVMKGAFKADSFLTVGGWVQYDSGLYRKMIDPFKGKLERKEIVVVMSDATDSQLAILGDRLAHVNIGQMPYEMGKMAIRTLYKIVKKQKYEKTIYTPFTYCTPGNFKTCSDLK